MNGNTTSAPTTPPGRPAHGSAAGAGGGPVAPKTTSDKPAPIGQGREMANGAKSMPASRRASGFGPTFGLEKLSLSVMEPSGAGKTWTDDDDVDTEGAASGFESHLVLKLHTDRGCRLGQIPRYGRRRPFPCHAEERTQGRCIPFTTSLYVQLTFPQNLSAASAALDLAALSQTSARAYGARPFETSLKTSDWPTFPTGGPNITSPLPHTAHSRVEDSILGNSRKTSPTGMADSVASLPAIPSKSVPGTPFGLSAPGSGAAGVGGIGGVRRSETSPNINDGLTQAQRGFSNPDLAKTFGRAGVSFHLEQPRVSTSPPTDVSFPRFYARHG